MWYFIAVFIIAAGVFLSCNNKSKANNNSGEETKNVNYISGFTNPTDTIKAMYSINDIKKKLKKLAESEPPKKLAFGAMCYKVAMPPETASYTCPVCQHKTLHKRTDDNWGITQLIQWGINACRNEIKNVEGINLKLDESQFCKKCSPEVEKPQLCLNVSIANKTNKVCDIDYLDIKLIDEFLKGELKHKGSRDSETPMKNHIDRIQELLGVKIEE